MALSLRTPQNQAPSPRPLNSHSYADEYASSHRVRSQVEGETLRRQRGWLQLASPGRRLRDVCLSARPTSAKLGDAGQPPEAHCGWSPGSAPNGSVTVCGAPNLKLGTAVTCVPCRRREDLGRRPV